MGVLAHQLRAVNPSQPRACYHIAQTMMAMIAATLVVGVVPPHDIMSLYGPSTAGKTVLALAACLILNTPGYVVSADGLTGYIPEKQSCLLRIRVPEFVSKAKTLCNVIAKFFLQLPKKGVAVILFDEAHKGSNDFWNILMQFFDSATVSYVETKAAAKARRRQPLTEVRCPLPLLIFVAATPGTRGHSVYNEEPPTGEELSRAVAEELREIFAIDELRSRIIHHLCAFEPLSPEALHQQFVKLLNITKRADSVRHLADECSFDDDCLQYVKQQFVIRHETRSIMKEVNAMLRAALLEASGDELASWKNVRIKMQTVNGVVGMVAYGKSQVRAQSQQM